MFSKVLITSDIHLSDTIWKHRPIYGDAYHSWHYIIDYAIANSVDAVILAGDILDKQQNVAKPISELVHGLQKLDKAGIKVLYNQGQHEYQKEKPWLDVANCNAKHLSVDMAEEYFLSNGLKIAGFDYCNDKTLAENLTKIGKDSTQGYLLVCHQVWKDFMGDVGRPQGCFDDIPANVKILVTGDYHEHMVHKHNDGALWVLSPGSTHLRNLTEPADKAFFVLDVKSDSYRVVSETIPTRVKFEVATGKQPHNKLSSLIGHLIKEAATEKLPEELRKPVVRVIHNPDELDFARHVKDQFEDKAHLFFKLRTVVAETLTSDTTPDESRTTLKACLPDELDPQAEPAAFNLASELLSGGDPTLTLERWLEEMLDAD